MKQTGILIIFCVIISLAFTIKGGATKSHYLRVVNALPDTTFFSPNLAKGWSMLSCYFNKIGQDSVVFEVIIKHSSDLEWSKEQMVGIIKDQNFLPKKEQRITYHLLPKEHWVVGILPNGKCFLNISKGAVMAGSHVVIPISIKYKIK